MNEEHDENCIIHFLGIGGIGMSALAHIVLEKGRKVCGIDRNSSQITRRLEEKGATISIGDDPHFDGKVQVISRISPCRKTVEMSVVSSLSVFKHVDGRTTTYTCHMDSRKDLRLL